MTFLDWPLTSVDQPLTYALFLMLSTLATLLPSFFVLLQYIGSGQSRGRRGRRGRREEREEREEGGEGGEGGEGDKEGTQTGGSGGAHQIALVRNGGKLLSCGCRLLIGWCLVGKRSSVERGLQLPSANEKILLFKQDSRAYEVEFLPI